MIPSRALLLAGVAALALGACSGSHGGLVPAAGMAAPDAAQSPLKAAPSKLKTTPAELNFATKPVLKLRISEAKYSGKFKISASPKGLIKLSSTKGNGPNAKISITALKAGSGKITVTDDQGGKKVVPFTVTQAVIIISGAGG